MNGLRREEKIGDPRQSFTWSVASAKPEVFDAVAVLLDEKNEIERGGRGLEEI